MPSIIHYHIVLDPHPYYDISSGQTFITQDPIYRPGQWVSGHIIILMKEKTKVRAVRLWFKGFETVKLQRRVQTQRRSGRGRRRTHTSYRTIESTHYMINERPTLMGRPKNTGNFMTDDIYLQPNQHYAFPFQFFIPMNALPTYYYDDSKFIKYQLYSNIDRPWKFDYQVIQDIRVLPSLFVNQVTMGPPIVEMQQAIKYLWLFSAGHLKYRIQLMRNIFTIGEYIPIGCILERYKLTAMISQISASIEVKGSFSAQGQQDCVVESIGQTVSQYSMDKMEYMLNVPLMPPKKAAPFTILGQCINFTYTVKVVIHFTNWLIPNIVNRFEIQVHPAAPRITQMFTNNAVLNSAPIEQPQQIIASPPRKDIPQYPQEQDDFEAPAVNHRFWPKEMPPPYVAIPNEALSDDQ